MAITGFSRPVTHLIFKLTPTRHAGSLIALNVPGAHYSFLRPLNKIPGMRPVIKIQGNPTHLICASKRRFETNSLNSGRSLQTHVHGLEAVWNKPDRCAIFPYAKALEYALILAVVENNAHGIHTQRILRQSGHPISETISNPIRI